MGLRLLLTLCGVILVSVPVWAAGAPPARIFSQAGMARDLDGQLVPPVVLDPASRDDLVEQSFDLGRGRTLVLRTNLPAARRDEASDLAAVVRRCHDFVEAETGRQVRGDLLLYILSCPTVPCAYSFRVELAAPDRWSQVRLALLDEEDTLTGATASSQLKSLLYGTLPHELGHGLIGERPTVLHDVDGHASHHTRWFTEGVCEALALRFAQQECPTHAWRLMRNRRIGEVLDSPAVRDHLFRWAQADRLGWDLESDLYGAAMLVVHQWLRAVSLADLLADLAGAASPANGAALMARLTDNTGLTLAEVLDQAALAGRGRLSPAYSRR